MLNIKKIFAVLIACLTVFMLCACGENRNESGHGGAIENVPSSPQNKPSQKPETNPSSQQPQADITPLVSQALEKLAAIPEYPEGYPTVEAVSAQYKKTCQAIGWIVGTELVATDADYTYEAHGLKYYKVLPDCYLGSKDAGKNPDADMLIYNKETFEAYLATLISSDEASDYIADIDESFEVPRFIEDRNGELYALPYAFPPAGYADDSTDTFELAANDDGSYTLTVRYFTLDDDDNPDREHTYSVKYVNENGRWVFKNFRLVKQH